MRKKVFMRTDANQIVASGHVMRSLSLADALARLGLEVAFVLSDNGPEETIRGRGFPAVALESDWRDIMDGVERMKAICQTQREVPVVLVDTYSITKEYVDELARFSKVCYLGSKPGDLGPLSLLVNYSTEIDEPAYEATYRPYGTRLLLGARYAPIRRQFPESARGFKGGVDTVLVTTGNTDAQGFVPCFLEKALSSDGLCGVLFEVVVGSMFPDGGEIDRIAGAARNVGLNRDVKNMAALMGRCDAAVSANGTTVYELSSMGVPSITFAMVDEQRSSAESLSRLGVVAYAGALSDGLDVVASRATTLLEGFVSNPGDAGALADRAHSLVDGRGAERIAKEVALL